MKYEVEITVRNSSGKASTINGNVDIEYDAERDLYKAKSSSGVWTYGELSMSFAARVVIDEWRKSAAQ